MKKSIIFIFLLLMIILNIINAFVEKKTSDYENLSLEELVLASNFFLTISDSNTGRYIGYIANKNGIFESGFEGEFQGIFIYKIDKINNEYWDIYIQNTGYFYDEIKEYRNWIFPECYKVVLTKKDIINKLQNPEKIAGLFCDRSINYPTSCHALVITENLRIRSKPSIAKDSNIIGKYRKFTDIVLYDETSNIEELDGIKGYWNKVKLKDGTEGWVFGGYVRIYFRETDIEMIKKAFSNSL